MTSVMGLLPDSMEKEKRMIEGFIKNTAQMLAYTVSRGIKGGWLDYSYLKYGIKMRNAAHKKVDSLGLLQGV